MLPALPDGTIRGLTELEFFLREVTFVHDTRKWLWAPACCLSLQETSMGQEHLETITLGAGVFGVEAVYESIPGVDGVSGYSGGHIKNPGYRSVHRKTGYAEVVQVTFDNPKSDWPSCLRSSLQPTTRRL